jgi:hypothetical protein
MTVQCKDGSTCSRHQEHFIRFLSVCLPHRARTWIHEYKGFLSKEDGYLDYTEWHVLAWSSILSVATFVLSELFAGLYLLMTLRVVRDEYSEHSSLSEIDGELPYWFGAYVFVALVLRELGYSADFSVLFKLAPILGLA